MALMVAGHARCPGSMRAKGGFLAVQVAYSGGSTQGGSSGAPLIDAQSQLIVGVLSGGHASCDDTDAFDYYGPTCSGKAALALIHCQDGDILPLSGAMHMSKRCAALPWQHQYCGDTVDRPGGPLKPAAHALCCG